MSDQSTKPLSKKLIPKRPVVLGLTGSIGMGKSATADLFRKLGIPVHDSDAAVHGLYAAGGAAAPIIASSFPGTMANDGSVDRGRLREAVLGKPDEMRRLESLVHPLVRAESDRFVKDHGEAALVVLDIPLLFETGAQSRCDAVLVVSAPAEVQQARVLARPGMNESMFDKILAMQMPDAEKRQRADFVIETNLGFAHVGREVARLVETLTSCRQSG